MQLATAPRSAALRTMLATAAATATFAASMALTACAAVPTRDGAAEQVAPGVYMVRGAAGESGPENLGRVGNAGFIVGPGGVLAIDSGTSYRQGVALLAAIRRVTNQPVRMLLLTHTRQEFLFGAAAFREQGIPVQMQTQAARLMAARCEGCLKTLQRVLGEDAMRGTAVLKPESLFDDTLALSTIGRPVRVLYFGHSSGPGDVAVLDDSTGTLFAGGLLDNGRIPDVQDSRLDGWGRALAALRALRLRHIVPGHGPAADATLIDTVERYLTQLQARALALLQADTALSQVPDSLQLQQFEGWDQYDTIHRRNASVVFLRLEQDRLLHDEGPR